MIPEDSNVLTILIEDSVPAGPRRTRGRQTWLFGAGIVGSAALAILVLWGWEFLRHSRLSACKAQLGTIALAFHAFENAHNAFPAAAITDRDGRPLLSWRVALLPYLAGGESLHREFHLDEPWDSPHNVKLVAKMPAIFGCPSDPGASKGMTPYRVVVSDREVPNGNPMFQLDRGTQILEGTDGISNTLLMAESAESAPWTKPVDHRFALESAVPKFGSRRQGGFHMATVDGTVRFLKTTVLPAMLKVMITRDGGEVILG